MSDTITAPAPAKKAPVDRPDSVVYWHVGSNGTLSVIFRSRMACYRYFDVEPVDLADFQNATRKGQFVQDRIKPKKYRYEASDALTLPGLTWTSHDHTVQRDGDHWLALRLDFNHLETDCAGFGATIEEAYADLVKNEARRDNP